MALETAQSGGKRKLSTLGRASAKHPNPKLTPKRPTLTAFGCPNPILRVHWCEDLFSIMTSGRGCGFANDLFNAIETNDIAAASSLIARVVARKADPDLIHSAASFGRVEILSMLLDAGVDVNALDNLGRNACHLAIDNGHLSVLELLIARGASIHLRDNYHNSTLELAIYNHESDDRFAIMLVDAGAPLDSLALHHLVQAAALSLPLLNRLLAQNIDACALQDHLGCTPLHHINVRNADFEAHVCRLVDLGVDINATSNVGDTPLHCMVTSPVVNESILQLLIELGADVDRRNQYGWTALHCIIGNAYHHDCHVQFLLAAGANVELVDDRGQSVLHWAALHANVDALCAILAAGADLDQPDNFGDTPRMLVTQRGCRLP